MKPVSPSEGASKQDRQRIHLLVALVAVLSVGQGPAAPDGITRIPPGPL